METKSRTSVSSVGSTAGVQPARHRDFPQLKSAACHVWSCKGMGLRDIHRLTELSGDLKSQDGRDF